MARVARNEAVQGGRKAAAGRAPQRHSFLTVVLLFFAVVLLLDGLVGERGWLANRRARLEYEREAWALHEVRQRNQATREQVARVKCDPSVRDKAGRMTCDPSAIEEIARRDLGLVKPGEKIVVVRDLQKKK